MLPRDLERIEVDVRVLVPGEADVPELARRTRVDERRLRFRQRGVRKMRCGSS